MLSMIFGEDKKNIAQMGLGTPLLVIMLLAMMILPLPPFMLDMLFTFNMAFALVVLLTCVYVDDH